MSFPTGWTHKFTLTIDKTKVTGSPSNFVLLVTKDMLPTSVIDAGGTSAQDGGGDIRFTNDSAGSQRLPIEVVDFHPDATSGNRRCEIWVNMAGYDPSSGADKVIYGWCKGPNVMTQPYPSHAYGQESVWSTQDYRAVHHGNASFAPDFYGLWLIRGRAAEDSLGNVYVTWLSPTGATGNIKVAKWVASTGMWSAAVTITTAELIDAHCAPSVCVDSSDYVHVTWAGFSATNFKVRTVKATNVRDHSAWDSVVDIATGGVADRTYPCVLPLTTGNLVATYREAGTWIKKASTDNGSTWGSAETILTGERAYCEWIVGPSNRIHLAWHTTASSGATNGLNLYYLYCDNPTSGTSTWKAIDGTSATLPVSSDGPTTVSGGRVFNTTGASFTTSYLRGIAVDGSNNPMLSCDSFVSGTPASSACSSFTYSGGSWTKVDLFTGATVGLPSTGSPNRAEGGVRFISGTTWRMLVGIFTSSKGEVQEWETTDGGATWSKLVDITASSGRGNIQSQYVRPWQTPVGLLTATWIISASGNEGGEAINNTSDSVCMYGPATDGVGGYVPGIITGTTYLRDSTKYRNHATATGTPSQTTGVMTGYGQAVTSSNYYSIANNSTISADLTTTLHLQQWITHTSASVAEKTSTKNPSAGAGAPWVMYRDGSNNAICFFGSASTFVAPTSSGGASSTYRHVAQYFSATGSARLNKTAITGISLTGPLATVSNSITLGNTLAGTIDEFRIGPTQITANTLDTEYDNQNSPSTFATGADVASIAGNPMRGGAVGYPLGGYL